jgi:hypothetical protein
MICAIMTTLAHSSLLIHDFLTKHEMTLNPQHPYLPDFAPVDFHLFTGLKFVLKGHFSSIKEIKKICWQQLCSIPQEALNYSFKHCAL